MRIFFACLVGCCILLAKGLLPSEEVTEGRPDYSHASITLAAIYRATSDVKVISPGKYNASDPDGTITTYFGNTLFLLIICLCTSL